jgi:hypothetical protein
MGLGVSEKVDGEAAVGWVDSGAAVIDPPTGRVGTVCSPSFVEWVFSTTSSFSCRGTEDEEANRLAPPLPPLAAPRAPLSARPPLPPLSLASTPAPLVSRVPENPPSTLATCCVADLSLPPLSPFPPPLPALSTPLAFFPPLAIFDLGDGSLTTGKPPKPPRTTSSSASSFARSSSRENVLARE